MLNLTPLVPDGDVTVHIVLNDFGDLGRAYVETDEAAADEATIVENILTGQYSYPLRVVAFNTAEGWSRDVTEDIAVAAMNRVRSNRARWKGRAGVFGTSTRGDSADSLPLSKTRRLSEGSWHVTKAAQVSKPQSATSRILWRSLCRPVASADG